MCSVNFLKLARLPTVAFPIAVARFQPPLLVLKQDRKRTLIKVRTGRGHRWHWAAFAAALSVAVTGCGTTPPPAVGPVTAAPVEALGQSDYSPQIDPNYRLHNTDVISVSVFREPDFSVESVPIGADGMVSLPLIGAVQASGLTLAELTANVTEQLDVSGLRRPSVSINVLEHASHLVTVEGGVSKPGVYNFSPGAKLSSAIALASGPNRVAKLREVAIFRETQDGMMVAKFDYAAVSEGTMIDPVIRPGDRVVVGMSSLSLFWQDLLRALPAFGIFTNVNF